MAEVMQRYRVQTGRKNGDKVARPTGGSKLLNNTGETAVPLSPTKNVRRSLCVVCSEQRRSGATGSQIPARDIPTYDERDPPEEEKNREQKQRKKEKNRVTRGEGFLSSVANRRAVDFPFFPFGEN